MHSQTSTFGVSAAAMIERHLAFILRRFKVEVQDGDAAIADLYPMASGLRLVVEEGIPREEQLEHVAIQLGYAVLGFKRPEKRVPLFSEREREEYAQVVYRAARLLIPDKAIMEAEREGWNDRKLAHECSVTLRMARVRIKRRKAERLKRPSQLGAVVELQARVALPPPAPTEYIVDADGIRYVPSTRYPGVKIPIPEDRARWAKLRSDPRPSSYFLSKERHSNRSQ